MSRYLINIKNKIETVIYTISLWMVTAQAAFAEGDSISEQTADAVSGKVINLVQEIAKPLGAAVILLTVVICAFKIITTANKPEERARAIGALPYIIGGGVLLGGAMITTGFIMGLGSKLGE